MPPPDTGTTAPASHVTMNRSLSYISSLLSVHPDPKNKPRREPSKLQRHPRHHHHTGQAAHPFSTLPRNYARPPTPPEKDHPRVHNRTQSASSSSPSNYSSDSDTSDAAPPLPARESLSRSLTRRLSIPTRTKVVPKRPITAANDQQTHNISPARTMDTGSESEAHQRRPTKALSDLGHGGGNAHHTLRSRRGLSTNLGGISLTAPTQQNAHKYPHSPPSTAPIISDNRGRGDRFSRDTKLPQPEPPLIPPPKPPKTPREASVLTISSNPPPPPHPDFVALRTSAVTGSQPPSSLPSPTQPASPEHAPNHTRFPATTNSVITTRSTISGESVINSNSSEESQILKVPPSHASAGTPSGATSPQVSAQPLTFPSKETTSHLQCQKDHRGAKITMMDSVPPSPSDRPPTPPPRALFNIDYNAPPPPRPPRFHSPLPARPRGDLEAVKQALLLPPSVAAALASNEPTYSTMEDLPTVPESITKVIPESHTEPDAVESTAPTTQATPRLRRTSHRREGALVPSPSSSSSSPLTSDATSSPTTSSLESGVDSVLPRGRDTRPYMEPDFVHLTKGERGQITKERDAVINDNDGVDDRREGPFNQEDDSDFVPITVIAPPPQNASLMGSADKKERYIDDGEKWVKVGFRDRDMSRTPSPERRHPSSHSHVASHTRTHTLPPPHLQPLTSTRSQSPERDAKRGRKDSTPNTSPKGLRNSLTNGLKRFSSTRAPSTSSRSANRSSTSTGTRNRSRTPSPTDATPAAPASVHGHGHARKRSTEGGYAGIGAGGGAVLPFVHVQHIEADLPPLPVPKNSEVPKQKIKTTNPSAMSCQEVYMRRLAVAERCKIYTHKLNELHGCDTGLHDWLIEARFGAPHTNNSASRSDRTFTPQPRQTSRSSVMSDASFPRRPDASTATDLTQKAAADDLAPTAPPPTLPYPSLAASRGYPQRSNSVLASASTLTIQGSSPGSLGTNALNSGSTLGLSLPSSPTHLTAPVRTLSTTSKAAGFFSSLGKKASIARRGQSHGPTSPTSTGLLSSTRALTKSPPPLNITHPHFRDESVGSGDEGWGTLPGQMVNMSTAMVNTTTSGYTRRHLLSNPTAPGGPRPKPNRISRSQTMISTSPTMTGLLSASRPRQGSSETGHGSNGYRNSQQHHNYPYLGKADNQLYQRVNGLHGRDGSSNSSSHTITQHTYLDAVNGNDKLNRHSSLYNVPSAVASYQGHGLLDTGHSYHERHHLSQPPSPQRRPPPQATQQPYQHHQQQQQPVPGIDPEFNRQLDKLAGIVPNADRYILSGYLRRAGQDVLAIGQYLEDERNHALKMPDAF